MLVKFKTNVGSVDAAAFGLDFKQCLRGATLEVDAKTGAAICQRGLATEAKAVEVPVPLKAVPPVDLKTSEPAVKSKGDKKNPD